MSEEPSRLERATHLVVAATLFVLAGIFLWSGEIAAFKWMNHDVANALYVGEKVLEGDRLYVDWYYFVMPPIVFLDSALCRIAELVGLSPPSVNHLFVLATAGLGFTVLASALADARARRSGVYSVAVLAYLGVLVCPGPFWHFFGDFGQREHLFVLLLLPYFLWRLSGTAPTGRVLVLSVALGYGMMNKPHFVALVALIELFHLRDLRQSGRLWGALAVGAALPFALLLLNSPESFAALFTGAVSYHLSDSYDAFSMPWVDFLGSRRNVTVVTLGCAVLGLVAIAWRRGCLDSYCALQLGTLIVASYLTFLQQQKLFRYHAIPLTALAMVSASLLSWKLAATLRKNHLRRGLEAGVLAFVLFQIGFGLYGLFDRVVSETRAEVAAALPFLDELEDARLIAVLSPSVEGRLFTFTFGHDVEIMGPWTSNYTLGGLLRVRDPAERERQVRAYFAPIAKRIREEAPELVAFSPMNQSLPGGTLHDEFVDRYGLFPSPEYSRRKRFANGWVVYRRASRD